METRLRVYDTETNCYVKEGDWAMELAGLDPRMGFEEFGLQADGTPIVCDRCGRFGYLDKDRFEVRLCLMDAGRTAR